jgi:hypothetical protein
MDRTFYMPSLGRHTADATETAAPAALDDLRSRMLQELQMFLTVQLASPQRRAGSMPGSRPGTRTPRVMVG